MSNTNQQVQQAPKNEPKKLIEDAQTREKFVNLFMGIHKCDKQKAEQLFENESFAFLKILTENPDLQDCSQLSMKGCFLEAVNSGLSFSKSKNLVYLTYRNITVKQGTNSYKEKRMVWDETPDGEVYLRQRVGSVKYVKTPIIVYDCDNYSVTGGSNPSIFHELKLPKPEGAKVVLGYTFVIDGDGKEHLFWIDTAGIERLKKYSERNNGEWVQQDNGKWKKLPGKANELYTSENGGIDSGFFSAKIKKFAVKDYRKEELPEVIVSQFRAEIEAPNEKLPELPEPPANAQYAPTMMVAPLQQMPEPTEAANEFSPDAPNDLPFTDSESPEDIQPDNSTLFNNQF